MTSSGRLLIVGMGMVGSAVRAASWTRRFEVLAASRKAPGVAQLDIGSREDVKTFFKRNGPFSAVINCAAEANVDACESDPETARRVNALGVKYLAENCAAATPLIHISTDYVFDGLRATPYTEDDPTGPRSIYGITKLEGEHYALTVPRVSAVIRSTWIFGGERTDFVNGMIDRLKRGERPAVVDDQTASPAHASDLGEALGRVLERFALPARAEGRRANRVFHLTSSGQATRHAMAVRIARALRAESDLPRAAASDIPGWIAIRPRYTVMDAGRAERELGVRMRGWEEALDEHVRSRGK